MKDDLLILRLLKVPVTIIKYLSKGVAMLTYLPNYLVILALDTIIFSQLLSSTLFYYIISWPLRLLSLVGVVAIFCAQFYCLYTLLSISHFHWGVQLALTFIAFQGVLALMRHGYLTMIKKFSPTKLKSPLEHLVQIRNMFIDIIGIVLTVFNTMLIINIFNTFNYQYNSNKSFVFIKHISKLIHTSVLDIIKLFYIKVFFRIFPWRYLHSYEEVQKQQHNILQLTVLLTLLFLTTLVDILFLSIFGIYCYFIHPRKAIYRKKLGLTHQKYKATAQFLLDSSIQIIQCTVLLFCMPFKYSYSKQVLQLVLASSNDYSFHYPLQTLFVLKLALVKIPSLFCELILLLSVYKYKKVLYLMKLKRAKLEAGVSQSKIVFKPKKSNAAPQILQQNKQDQIKQKQNQKSYEKQMRHQQKQYVVFRCFGSLVKQIPFVCLVPFCTLLKLWNLRWLKYLIDGKYDIRCSYVVDYFFKILIDYLSFLPTILSILILGFYDPIKQNIILKAQIQKRKQLRKKLPLNNSQVPQQALQFYNSKSASMPKILSKNGQQIKKDIFFLPLLLAARLTLISAMDCQHPSDAVQLFQHIWMLFYMRRVKKTPYFNQYVQFLRADEAAGMIKTHRQRLRFWKFAHKSCRHRLISRIISRLLPKKRADKAIVNAPIQRNFSAIANHYWHRYNITIALLQYLLYFIIELIITFVGVVFLLPLTLWRMPTFLILFKTHKYNKKYFFSILFKMYKQMAKDLYQIFVKIFTFILFPRATLSFLFNTTLRYTEQGVTQFERIQKAKMWYIVQKILLDGLSLYTLLFKIVFVKVFWVRKRDMNRQLKQMNIRLSVYVKDFLLTSQITPNIEELQILYGGFSVQQPQQKLQQKQQKQEQKSMKKNIQNVLTKNKQKFSDINTRGLLISSIVQPYVWQTKEDIPYLLLMIFLLVTLPWRLFYIKNALFLMRDDNTQRRQFFRLLKMIAKDYQSIMLYVVLLFSIVKTKRAVVLFVRNVKLNFYVGTLKYSHLKELRQQVKEAGHFYYGFVIMLASCIFGPYRILQIVRNLRQLYKVYRQQKWQNEVNKKMYDNTVKQGKSLQLLTGMGHNSLLHVFRFLDARELTKMTQVSKYMYDTIKERDQVWMEMWGRLYQTKYPAFVVKNDLGNQSYHEMCVEKYKLENQGHINDNKDRFFKLALHQFNQSTFETILDLKAQLAKFIPASTHHKIFTSLSWDLATGYGPEQNWPRPDDNQQYLQLFGIERRPVVELTEDRAWVSWLWERPVQFIIIRMNRFYNLDTHRRKKQIAYVLFNALVPISLLFLIIKLWSWIWTFDILFGYKFLLVIYLGTFIALFLQRYTHQARDWVTLHPYDIINDIRIWSIRAKDWVQMNSVRAGNYMKDKVDKYIWRPLRWVGRKINSTSRWFGRKVKYAADLFIQKVAKPLYISISHKIVAVWKVIKALFKAFTDTIIKIFQLGRRLIVKVYSLLFQIVKSISKVYANSLEYALKLSLRNGTLGQLVFTIIVILCMISPSIICYYFYTERWFIIFSTLMTMVLMVTGYKHLNRMKERVLAEMRS